MRRKPGRSCAKIEPWPQESTLRFGAQTDEVTSLLRIVNMVRTGDASTRPEIGRVTGLGRGVVTQRVDQAIEMGYLEDGEFGPSSGGRAPRTLRFRGDRGRIIVCALGALHIHVGIAMLEGDILEQTPPRVGHRARTGRDARHRARDDRRAARARRRTCRSGASPSASPGRSTSRPAVPSRRRSCRAGTGSTSAAGSRSATTHRSGSTTT